MRVAFKTNPPRLPDEAKEVMQEIRDELVTYIWETLLQRQTRIDREFESLVQGGLSHAEFRALFEDKLQDIRECPGMDMPSEKLLYRKYLAKIKPEYRLRVMQKDWKIDGEDNPPRTCKTYHDVAKAIALSQEETADIIAVGHFQYDSVLTTDERSPVTSGGAGSKGQSGPKGGAKGAIATQCNYCHAVNNHYTSQCPQKAADTRGEAAACRAKAATTGVGCALCHAHGHDAKHLSLIHI